MLAPAGRLVLVFAGILPCSLPPAACVDDPPALNPFDGANQKREDAVAGYLELSDGTVLPGQIFLTRDGRLKIFDEKQEQHREIPLKVIQQVVCTIQKEWLEKEWRFKENANDEKYFTGHKYPVREYMHTITLRGGRKIQGPLSGVIYVQTGSAESSQRFILHKRDKGELDSDLKSLVHVRAIYLGEKAFEEGKQKVSKSKPPPGKDTVPSSPVRSQP
jgi:hypothetical protein